VSEEPLVTIVSVPRERFSAALPALENLYANTPEPFRLVYVDGGSPPRVRRALERAAQERAFQIVRTDHYLTPNQARNLGLKEVTTRYLVFIDNDAFVTPGWLEPLMRCAEETGAALVAPVVLFGTLEEESVHITLGDCRIDAQEGRRIFVEVHRDACKKLSEIHGSLRRAPTELVEYHCMFARREALERNGPLDERLMSMFEHCDLALCLREAGETLWFEPESVVAYHPAEDMHWSDLRYFNLRWSDGWNRASLARFQEKWEVDPESPALESTLSAARFQQRLMFGGARRWLHWALGPVGNPVRRALVRSELTLRNSLARHLQ